jgi:hypothetical protein
MGFGSRNSEYYPQSAAVTLMKLLNSIRLTGAVLTVIIALVLGTGCQTWKAYPGSVLKGDDAVLVVSPTDILAVWTVDGLGYPKDPQSEFQGSIRLLPGFHRVTFVLQNAIPGPYSMGRTITSTPITKRIFVEAGKTYVTHPKFSSDRWTVEITEKP